MTYRLTMLIDVDEEALAEHDGDEVAPPNNINEWYGGDVERAFALGLAEPVHEPLLEIEEHVEAS